MTEKKHTTARTIAPPPAPFGETDPDLAHFEPANVLAAEVARLAERLATTERELMHLRALTLPVDLRSLRYMGEPVSAPSPVNSMSALEHELRKVRRSAALRELGPREEVERLTREIGEISKGWIDVEAIAAKLEQTRAAWAASGWAVAPGICNLRYVPEWIGGESALTLGRALTTAAETAPRVVVVTRYPAPGTNRGIRVDGVAHARGGHGFDDVAVLAVNDVDAYFGDVLHHTDRAKLAPLFDHVCTADRIRVVEDFDVMRGERWRLPRVGDLVRSSAGGAAEIARLEAELAEAPAKVEAQSAKIRDLVARRDALLAALTGGAS